MPQPEGCPDMMYGTMLQCWEAEPTARSSFSELVRVLAAEQQTLQHPFPSSNHLSSSTKANISSSGAPPLELNPPVANYISGFGAGSPGATEAELVDATTKYADGLYLRVTSIDGKVEIADTSARSPLAGLATTPLVGLREAVAAAEKHATCAGGLSAQLEEAFAFATSKVHSGRSKGLTVEQVAAINLYTQESQFYKGLNGALGGWGVGGQAAIHYYLPYMKILMGALDALPPIETIAYRGIRGVSLETLLKGKGVGDELAWWAVTSATETADVLRDSQFFGIGAEHGERVVFVIEVKSGVRVKSFSSLGSILEYYMQPFGSPVQNEDEITLKPGTTFVIDSITSFTTGVTEVKMHEVSTLPSPDVKEGDTDRPTAAPNAPSPMHSGAEVGYLQVSAGNPPLLFATNMIIGDTYEDDANSSDDESNQLGGVNRFTSSARLLSESCL